MIFNLILIAGAFGILYALGWVKFTRTGVLKPFIGLTVAGFSISIKKPDAQ